MHSLTSRDAARGPFAAKGWDDPAGAVLMENPLDPPLELVTSRAEHHL